MKLIFEAERLILREFLVCQMQKNIQRCGREAASFFDYSLDFHKFDRLCIYMLKR